MIKDIDILKEQLKKYKDQNGSKAISLKIRIEGLIALESLLFMKNKPQKS